MGVAYGPLHASRTIAGRDVRTILQPLRMTGMFVGEHEGAEQKFVLAEFEEGFIASQGDGGNLIGVERAVAKTITIVTDKGIALDGINRRLQRGEVGPAQGASLSG